MVSNNVIAILLGILANSIYNIGLIFKRKGIRTLPQIEEHTFWQNIKNFSRCRTWFFGFSLTLIQWFPLMYAINTGSLSLVAPTMAIGFVILILFSWFYLKEKIRVSEIIGIIIVMCAIITFYLIAPIDPIDYDLAIMNNLFKEVSAIAFLCTFAILITLFRIVTHKRKYAQAGALLAAASGFSYATATIFAKGTLSSLTFSNITDFIMNSFRAWQWWIYLALMCFGYFIAFTSQQLALQKGKALVVSPTVDVSRLFMQIIAGIFVFNEWHAIWDDLEPWKKAIKILSIIFILIGVAILSFFTTKDDELVATLQDTTEKEVSNEVDEAIQDEIMKEEISDEKAKDDYKSISITEIVEMGLEEASHIVFEENIKE